MNYRRVIVPRRGGPEVLQVVEAPLPEPRNGEVLVKVWATGVAFADILMREGLYSNMPKFPFTPGYDIVGVVERDSAQFKRGQVVVALTKVGGYAEFMCVPADALVPVSGDVDPAQAVSLVLNYLTAYQMLHRVARVSAGERILIHGAAGGVGTALLELGRLANLEMYGTASQRKHSLVRQLGGIPIDYQNEDFVERVKNLTGDGVDAVFDPVGGRQWARSYQTLRGGGRLVGYGFSAATTNGRRDPLKAITGWLQMPRRAPLEMMDPNKGLLGYNVMTLKGQRPDWYHADLAALIKLLQDGKINPLVAERIPLEQASRAQQLLGQNAVQGKLVLICNPS